MALEAAAAVPHNSCSGAQRALIGVAGCLALIVLVASTGYAPLQPAAVATPSPPPLSSEVVEATLRPAPESRDGSPVPSSASGTDGSSLESPTTAAVVNGTITTLTAYRAICRAVKLHSPAAVVDPPWHEMKLGPLSPFQCDAAATPVAKQNAKARAYLFPIPMKPSYGLTNQLLAYAGLFQLSAHAKRWLAPPTFRLPLVHLIDMERSSFHGKDLVVTDPCEVDEARRHYLGANRVVMRKRWAKAGIERWTIRESVAKGQWAIAEYTASVMQQRRDSGVEAWDMYLRWPFRAQRVEDGLVPFFCGIVFTSHVRAAFRMTLEAAAEALAARSNATGRAASAVTASTLRYVAIHLRLEPIDMSTQGRSMPSTAQVLTFFKEHVFPLAQRAGVRMVLLCAGNLADGVVPALQVAGDRFGDGGGIAVVQKQVLWAAMTNRNHRHSAQASQLIESLNEQRQRFSNRGRIVAATNARQAAIDVMLMEHAEEVVLTTYSSLTSLVVARRCCRSCAASEQKRHSSSSSTVDRQVAATAAYLYDVYRDGTVTALKPVPCGLSLSPYLEAQDMVWPTKPEEQLYGSHFNPTGGMFDPTQAFRNKGPVKYKLQG